MSESPVTVPVCYRHPSKETYVRCTRCDRSICPDCMTAASVGHQCPECVAEGKRTQRPARTAFGGSVAGRGGIATKALIGINVGFQYGINVWNRGIFDAIERHDASTVYFLSAVFLPLVLGSVALVTVQVSVRMMIQRRWRS